MTKAQRAGWDTQIKWVRELLTSTQKAIDELAQITPDMDADMKLCFAGNTLRGAEALLREADAIIRRKKRSR